MNTEIITHLSPRHPWANQIHYFDSIDSTSNKAKELALAGAPHGTVVIADHQTGGRGRLGRSFHSPAGCGLYLSVILRPDCHITDAMHLTCAAGVAAQETISRAVGVFPQIKWINDLVFDRQKLGGILAEPIVRHDGRIDFVILGIGINCNHKLLDFPPELQDMATSLFMITGQPTDRSRLAAELIRELEKMSQEFLTHKADMMDRYRKNCVTLGKEISVHRFEEVRHGVAVDLDDEGGLVVRFPDGHLETVNAGEVSIRGMYGYV